MPDRLRAFAACLPARRLLVAALVLAVVWVVFLDSHSLLRRGQLMRERAVLQAEIEQLRAENEVLEDRIERGLSNEVIEQVAREQYGMRRAGETVYPVETR